MKSNLDISVHVYSIYSPVEVDNFMRSSALQAGLVLVLMAQKHLLLTTSMPYLDTVLHFVRDKNSFKIYSTQGYKSKQNAIR